MNMQDRLRQYLNSKGLSYSEFEQRVGLSNSMAYKLNENIRKKTLARISAEFPDLNTSWLLYGEGEMLCPVTNITQTVTGNNNTGNNVTNAAADAFLRIIEQQQQTIARLTELLLTKNGLPSQADR